MSEDSINYKAMASSNTLHVEYAESRKKYHILFICSLIYQYSDLEYIRIYITHAEYGIRIFMAASQEYVKTYSTPRSNTTGGEGGRAKFGLTPLYR